MKKSSTNLMNLLSEYLEIVFCVSLLVGLSHACKLISCEWRGYNFFCEKYSTTCLPSDTKNLRTLDIPHIKFIVSQAQIPDVCSIGINLVSKHILKVTLSFTSVYRVMDLDEVLDEVGHFGRFQAINYVLVGIPILLSSVYALSYIFTAGELEYR